MRIWREWEIDQALDTVEEQERRIIELEKECAWLKKERDEARMGQGIAEAALQMWLEDDWEGLEDEYCADEAYYVTWSPDVCAQYVPEESVPPHIERRLQALEDHLFGPKTTPPMPWGDRK